MNMKKKFRILQILGLLLLFVPKTAEAAMRFGIRGVLPENQVGQGHDFFHLLLEPSEIQEIEIILTNETDEEITALIDIVTATTNPNGLVEYAWRDVEQDSSLLFPMEDIVTGPDTVLLPIDEPISVFLTITMPSKSLEGVLAGGITFMEVDTEEEEVAEGMTILNRFAFTQAIILRNSTQGVPAEFVLNEIVPTQQGMRTHISGNIQNTSPRFVNQVRAEAFVTVYGEDEVLFENIMESVQFAPNSNFDFMIPMDGERLNPGRFTWHMTLSTENDTWKFQSDFEIESETARHFNEQDISIQPESRNWLTISLIIGGAVVLIGTNIGTIVYFKKRNK